MNRNDFILDKQKNIIFCSECHRSKGNCQCPDEVRFGFVAHEYIGSVSINAEGVTRTTMAPIVEELPNASYVVGVNPSVNVGDNVFAGGRPIGRVVSINHQMPDDIRLATISGFMPEIVEEAISRPETITFSNVQIYPGAFLEAIGLPASGISL